MSLKNPKFGNVFEFQGLDYLDRTVVMYVAPIPNTENWHGLTLSNFRSGEMGWPDAGEIAARVPLEDIGIRRWKYLPDD